MAELGAFVGGLIPTLLVSRLGLWLLRGWAGGATRLLVVHGMSLTLIGFVAGIGRADYGAFAGLSALAVYAPPQAVWLIVDLVRSTRAQATQSPQEQSPQAAPSRTTDSYQMLWFVAAVLGCIVVSVAIMNFGTRTQRANDGQPWEREYSWETPQVAPAEAPADPALPAASVAITQEQCAEEIRRLHDAGYTQFNEFECFFAPETPPN